MKGKMIFALLSCIVMLVGCQIGSSAVNLETISDNFVVGKWSFTTTRYLQYLTTIPNKLLPELGAIRIDSLTQISGTLELLSDHNFVQKIEVAKTQINVRGKWSIITVASSDSKEHRKLLQLFGMRYVCAKAIAENLVFPPQSPEFKGPGRNVQWTFLYPENGYVFLYPMIQTASQQLSLVGGVTDEDSTYCDAYVRR